MQTRQRAYSQPQKTPSRGNKKFVDLVELERVYGKVKNPDDTEKNENDSNGQQNLLIQSYENRIQDLQKQLDLAGERENALISERKQLFNLLSAEKEEKRELMSPPEETRTSWWSKLTGRT